MTNFLFISGLFVALLWIFTSYLHTTSAVVAADAPSERAEQTVALTMKSVRSSLLCVLVFMDIWWPSGPTWGRQDIATG